MFQLMYQEPLSGWQRTVPKKSTLACVYV